MSSSVIENPSVQTEYPDADTTTVLNKVIAKNVSAYDNEASQAQSLRLGATSNVTLEAVNDVNIALNGNFSIFSSTYDSATRTDTELLNISDSTAAVVVTAPSSRSIQLSPSDAAHTVQAGSLSISDGNNYTYLDTEESNGLRFRNTAVIGNNAMFTSNAKVRGNLVAGADILTEKGLYAKHMNIWKDIPEAGPDAIDRVGFALDIDQDTLRFELIKMVRYNDAEDDMDKTVRTRKVAMFDSKTTAKDAPGDIGYLAFNAMNGVEVVEPAATTGNTRLWKQGDSNSVYFNGNGGVVIGESAPSDPTTTQLEVVNGNMKVDGSIVPAQDIVGDLGTPTKRWRDLYLSGNTMYIGGVAISAQSNHVDISSTTDGTSVMNNSNTQHITDTLYNVAMPTLSALSVYDPQTSLPGSDGSNFLTSVAETSNYAYCNLDARADEISVITPTLYPTSGGALTGNLYTTGNFTVMGTKHLKSRNINRIYAASNFAIINHGGAIISGLHVNRGTEETYACVYDDGTGTFKLGGVDTVLQVVTTRDDHLDDASVPIWDATSNILTCDPTVKIANAALHVPECIASGEITSAGSMTACNISALTFTGSLTGNAPAASTLAIQDTPTSAADMHYVSFVSDSNGIQTPQVSSSTALGFRPSDGTLTCSNVAIPQNAGVGIAASSSYKMHVYSDVTYPTRSMFKGLILYLDADHYDAGSSQWNDLSGRGYHFTVSPTALQVDGLGLKYMNFSGPTGIAKYVQNGVLTDVPAFPNVTIIAVTSILNSTSNWRTFLRSAVADHQIMIQFRANNLGMYDNNGAAFQSANFNVTTLPTGFNMLVWRLSSSSPYYQFNYNNLSTPWYTITTAGSIFTNGFAAIGGFHNGNTTPTSAQQYWGNVRRFLYFDRHLTDSEILAFYQKNIVTSLQPPKLPLFTANNARVLLENAALHGHVGMNIKNGATSSNAWNIGIRGGSSNLTIGYGSADSNASPPSHIAITPSGHIGFGVDDPQYPLDVQGGYRFGRRSSKHITVNLGPNQGDTVVFAATGGFMTVELWLRDDKISKHYHHATFRPTHLQPVGWQRLMPLVSSNSNTGADDWRVDVLLTAYTGGFQYRVVRNGTSATTNGPIHCEIMCNASAGISVYDTPTNIGTQGASQYWLTALCEVGVEKKVGVRTETPTHTLTVSQNSAAKPATSTWTITSDARLKENIQVADYDLCHHVVCNLDLKYYKWLDSNDIVGESNIEDRHMLGWIAQDVEQVFPKAVTTIPELHGYSNVKMMNADQIYSSMYGAVKQLMRNIAELKQDLQRLS